jgi:hypothetical protein
MGRFFKRLAAQQSSEGWKYILSLDELAEGFRVKQNRRNSLGDDFPGDEVYEVVLVEKDDSGSITGARAVGSMGLDWWIDGSDPVWVEDLSS